MLTEFGIHYRLESCDALHILNWQGLADILIETCLKEKGFRCIAGKFCDALATNVTVSFEGMVTN